MERARTIYREGCRALRLIGGWRTPLVLVLVLIPALVIVITIVIIIFLAAEPPSLAGLAAAEVEGERGVVGEG